MKQVSTSTQQSLTPDGSTSTTFSQKAGFPEASIAGTFIATAVSMFGFLLLVILFL